jgi:hypothetical protein
MRTNFHWIQISSKKKRIKDKFLYTIVIYLNPEKNIRRLYKRLKKKKIKKKTNWKISGSKIYILKKQNKEKTS